MVANLCLVTCALLAAQSADRSEWLLLPRLGLGQELIYQGSFTEEALGRGVQFDRSYRLENRVFVLDTPPGGVEVAFYTILKLRSPQTDRGKEPEPSSVRLELAKVSLQGRVSAGPGTSLAVPLDGPATVESGAFVEMPRGRLGLGQTWDVAENNRPSRLWKVLGREAVNATSCLKLEGLQQSQDWDQPRADHAAWRRRDTVWLSPRWGVAYKVERVIERREPGHQYPSERSVVRYELQSNLKYPDQLFADRRREILQARKFYEAAAPLLPKPAKIDRRTFEVMAAKIQQYVDNQPPTPYREAVLQVKRRVEAALRGESPPPPPSEEMPQALSVATIGRHAPDFVTNNLLTKESTHLRQWLVGRPLLLVFYRPESLTAEEVLRFANEKHSQGFCVLGLAVSDDGARIHKQCADLPVAFPILSGKGLRQSYAVDATPKLFVLDADGVVRGSYVGWGPETSATVSEELRMWPRKEERPKSLSDGKGTGPRNFSPRP